MKKTMAFVTCVVLMFSMAACGTKQDKKENQETENTTESKKEMVYESTELKLDGLKGDADGLCVKSDQIYVLTKEGEKNEEGMLVGPSVTRMYTTKRDGSDLKEIPLSEVKDDEYIDGKSLMVDSNNNIMYMTLATDEKTGGTVCYIVKIDEQGKELVKEDITNFLEITEEGYLSGPFKILVDDSDRVVVVTGKKVSVLDGNLKLLFEVKSDVFLETAVKTKDGTILCCSDGEDGYKAQALDLEQKEWGESYPLNIKVFQYNDILLEGLEYDFYYKNDSGMYGYDMEAKEFTKLMDYIASDIDEASVSNMVPLEKDKFIGSESLNGEMCIYVYNKVDPSKVAEKKTIVIGILNWLDDDVKSEAVKFNKENEEYRIEIQEYTSQTKLNADIIAGHAPDIICLRSLSTSQYVATGMLEDLTPYFDEDSEINTSDILDSVLDAMKIDGKLYYVCPTFNISTIIGSQKDVGTEAGWTFKEFKKLVEEKGEHARPFYNDTKVELMNALLECGVSDYIDWQTGECSFDSQDFKDILELCNMGKDEEREYDEDTPSLYAELKAGTVLFMGGRTTWNDIQFAEKLFDGGITFIGYPNKEKEGSYFSLWNNMGIYSKSEVKDGAWKFLRTFMTKEYQGTKEYAGFPTRKDCLDMLIKEKMATESYTDEFGREIQPISMSFGGDLSMELRPFSQEEVDLYIELIRNTKKVEEENEFIMEIIQEEVNAYFAGDKSVDETAKIIQNRVNTYVNENR